MDIHVIVSVAVKMDKWNRFIRFSGRIFEEAHEKL